MTYDPDKHHRRSIRLQGYDYSQPGTYFITVCTQNRKCLFGEIREGRMQPNAAGQMICRWYGELENKFPDIECDAFVCMPNHIHFIVVNVGADLRVRPPTNDHPVGADLCVRPTDNGAYPNRGERTDQGEHAGSPLRRVVQWFKTMTTNEYIRGVKQHRWPTFPGKLWQRNYYEHIVRNDDELNRIRQYIIDNPAKWAMDRENPEAVQPVMGIKRDFEGFGV